jgi:hypothetical protein
MSAVHPLESGSRHDLRTGVSPDAPNEDEFRDEKGAFGYCHSYETSSRYDGPGLRLVLFLSGCLLRCTYCHNPDTWHLKDGTYVSVDQVLRRIADFAPSIQALGGGLTWPASLGFTHVTERETEVVGGETRFRLSDALVNSLLPARKQILEDFQNNRPHPSKGPTHTLSASGTHG